MHEITADPEESNFVGAMIKIGKSLNHTVVAEGVETALQRENLQRHGCHEGQGFNFSHPLTAEQAASLLVSDLARSSVTDLSGVS